MVKIWCFRPVIACWWPQRMRVPTRNRGLEGPRHGSPRVPSWQRGIFGDDDFDEALHAICSPDWKSAGEWTFVRWTASHSQIWSGSRAESAFSFALAAGIAVGWSPTSRDGRFRPEVVRCSASPGALSTMIGLQVGVR